jgi:glycosyltransferase involved in cell wall biosynthesis
MKKVLIITYYWPPAGGAGVQRALKFVKYLPQFGWEPIVLTVKNADSPVDDETLFNDIPAGTKVFRTKSLEPFELYKKFTGKKSSTKIPNDVLINTNSKSLKDRIANWVRLNVFIPDAKIGWKRYAVKEGLKIIREENIDIIFTTSPPHTVQLIGKSLANKSGLKWIADFRDPWMELIHYQANKRSKLAVALESKIEKNILQSADKIITVSNEIKKLFNSKAENLDIEILPNGYDETDVNLETDPITKSEFVISYTGIISETKIPHSLFGAIKKLKDKGRSNIKIVFAGKVPENFNDIIDSYELEDNYIFKGYLSHNESVKQLLQSDVLLLIIDNIPNNKGILTGKLFEYIGTRKPIFAIGPIGGDAHVILKETNSGKMIDYENNEGAYSLLKEMYENWENDISPYTFEAEQFSRKQLTKKLANIFEETTK